MRHDGFNVVGFGCFSARSQRLTVRITADETQDNVTIVETEFRWLIDSWKCV